MPIDVPKVMHHAGGAAAKRCVYGMIQQGLTDHLRRRRTQASLCMFGAWRFSLAINRLFCARVFVLPQQGPWPGPSSSLLPGSAGALFVAGISSNRGLTAVYCDVGTGNCHQL